jgi:hypothetical protein
MFDPASSRFHLDFDVITLSFGLVLPFGITALLALMLDFNLALFTSSLDISYATHYPSRNARYQI